MIERLATFPIEPNLIAFRNPETLAAHLNSLDEAEVIETGKSREGRTLYGIRFGNGNRHVSIIGGSHADEPIGPMTAQALPNILREHFPEVLNDYTFHVVPQMNPDGAERNRPWFSNPFDLGTYLGNTVRELPGDDIEFGFGEGDNVRPECQAAQSFLAPPPPFTAHYSLHGMGFAEGVWCLIGPEWARRSDQLMDNLRALYERVQMPVHDVDRKGEKGFSRIREGFSTTPNSVAMKEFFLQRKDSTTADLFMPSSMEWIHSMGGDPLCIVSELPLFKIGKRSNHLEEPIKQELRDDLTRVRGLRGESRAARIAEVTSTYSISPVPIELQVRIQVAMILLGLRHTTR